MKNSTLLVLLIAAFLLGGLLLGAGIWIGQSSLRAMWGTGAYGPMAGPGMMGGPAAMMAPYAITDGETPPALSPQEAGQAVERYLESQGYADLAVGEVMIFDNGGYAQVVRKDTGEGAFEVLIDPYTQAVYLEHGPAMMWNTAYGMMDGAGFGMMGGGYGGMMGGLGFAPRNPEAEDLNVSPDRAVELAQDYLDRFLPGLQADDHADAFPGYYTLHTLKDDQVVGMLSVNAFTGQVWVHTWHGTLLDMVE